MLILYYTQLSYLKYDTRKLLTHKPATIYKPATPPNSEIFAINIKQFFRNSIILNIWRFLVMFGDLFDNPLKLVLIFAIVLVLFGANKLPEMGEGLGKGIRNFKKALSGETEKKEEEERPKEAN